jgi:hypothetical protein
MFNQDIMLYLSVGGGIVAILVFLFTISLNRKSSEESAVTRLSNQLRREWPTTLLRDKALMQRLVDILSIPLIRENFEISILVEEDELKDIAISVASKFDLVNVSPENATLKIVPASDSEVSRTIEAYSVDDEPVPHSSGNIDYELVVPPGGRRKIEQSIRYFGTSPIFHVFSQETVLRPKATVNLRSSVHKAVFLTGLGTTLYLQPREGGNTASLTTSNAVLPGESFVLGIV